VTKRALITGAAGQDGRYLAELLLGRGYRVYGVTGPDPGGYLAWARARGEMITLVEGDLTDAASLSALMRKCTPHEVYNFAGLSSVGASWADPERYIDINGHGVERLLAAIDDNAPDARLVQASSAEVFGDPQRSPQDEDTPIAPTNPYGESKAIGHAAVQAARARGMHASNAILYNHESPMRPVTFVTAKIADAAARIKLGLADELRLGNLDVIRDWGFAGDYVEAMARIASAEPPSDFVIATGEGHTVGQFAQRAFDYVGLDFERYVVVDPEFFREADAMALVGDSTRIRTQLGWTPAISFDRLVQMMVDAALERLESDTTL
jgi:GDPmannose 4,6-dehydratase